MPSKFVQPRRFSECFQMSEDWPGTLGQQVAVREALAVDFGSRQHKFLQKLDRELNSRERSHLPIAFVDLPWLGRGFATGILLRDILNVEAVGGVLLHELGHSYDLLGLWIQDDRDWFMAQMSDTDRDWSHHWETYADAFRDWWRGVGWQVMTNRLLRAQ